MWPGACTPNVHVAPKTPENPPQNGLFSLVARRLQVGCFAPPADLVALGPKDHLRRPGALGKDFEDKALARKKEFLGDTEAEASLKSGLEEQLDLPAGK